MGACRRRCGGGRDGSRETGFTLLEVLIAFAIAALGVALLLQIYGRAARLADITDRYSKALVVAQSVMAETGVLEPLSSGVRTGVADPWLRWRRTVKPADTPAVAMDSKDSVPVLYEVIVEVNWTARGVERSVELRSLRL